MLAITWKRDGVTHVKARLWGRSVKMCPSGDVIFIPGACWNAVRDTVRSTSRLRWTQTGAGTSRAPCFWWSALLRVPYRGGALFFVVRFEWFSSSPLMTTHQARGWEHRAREGKSNKENRTTEWNQVTFFFSLMYVKSCWNWSPGVRITNYLFLCRLSRRKYTFQHTVATVHIYCHAAAEEKRLKDEMISSTFLKYQGR